MKQIRNKLLIILLTTAFKLIVLAGYSVIAARSVDNDCINHGDVNLDGEITAADAQLAFFIVLGTYSPTYEVECAADCNGDGEVTAADAQAIFLVVLGLRNCVSMLATPTPTSGFVYISPGQYMRGSPESEPCRHPHEGPQHQVTLTRGFYMMPTEVTRQMWVDLRVTQPTLPSDPSLTSISPTMDHPVQRVTWHEAVLFANLMSLRDGYTRCYYKDPNFTTSVTAFNYTSGSFYCNFDVNGYRLPTEAEWEYAARASTTGPFSTHEPNYSSANCQICEPPPTPTPTIPWLNVLDSIAWWCGNSGGTAHPVGTKLPNPWGLHDMHGNVWEWCWDWYDYYPSAPVTNPTGPSTGSCRVQRGGSWSRHARLSRSANRSYRDPGYFDFLLGFRLVRTVP